MEFIPLTDDAELVPLLHFGRKNKQHYFCQKMDQTIASPGAEILRDPVFSFTDQSGTKLTMRYTVEEPRRKNQQRLPQDNPKQVIFEVSKISKTKRSDGKHKSKYLSSNVTTEASASGDNAPPRAVPYF
jgi:hypothetical protein